jgi:hypothetical protein
MPADLIATIAIIALAALIVARFPNSSGTCHRPPLDGFSLDEAHEMLRERIACHIESCDAKRAAYWMLADAGQITPDVRVVR